MFKKPKHRLNALMALTLSANLLSHPLNVQAEEIETEASNSTETVSENLTETPTVAEAPLDDSLASSDIEVASPIQEAQEPESPATSQEEVEPIQVTDPSEDTSMLATNTIPETTVSLTEQEETEDSNNEEDNSSDSTTNQTVKIALNSVNSEAISESSTIENYAQDFIMPGYKYANPQDDYWTRITALGGSQIPYVIINPSNGSGSNRIENFAQQIAANTAAGIKSIGYINTKEFGRSLSDVLSEADRYTSFYGSENISGFFFDEAEPGEDDDIPVQSHVDYMAALYTAIKSKYPHMIVMANPGRTVTNAISPYADIWLTRETSANDYLNGYYEQISDMEKDPASRGRVMHLVHSANPSDYDAIIALSRERNAGFLMITDTSFLQLPTDFENLVARINSGDSNTPSPSSSLTTSSTSSTTIVVPETSEEPTTSVVPTTTEKPSTSVVPTTSEKPTTSVVPTTSVEPMTSVTPSTSVVPTTTEKPTTSVVPTTSEKPTTSVVPETSEEPTTSEKPTTSVVPETSKEPTTSVAPETSEEPMTSVTLTTSTVSNTGALSATTNLQANSSSSLSTPLTTGPIAPSLVQSPLNSLEVANSNPITQEETTIGLETQTETSNGTVDRNKEPKSKKNTKRARTKSSSSQQASTRTTNQQNAERNTKNAAVPLALVGSVALIGLGLFLGKSFLKSKK